MSDYFIQNATSNNSFMSNQSWAILSPIETEIKRKIEAEGVLLKNWDVQINYGIKTGYNEAFIIDKTTKDYLISQSSKNAEIIRPILRGKDIKRYKIESANLWLLFIPWHFPLHTDNSIKGASTEAEIIFKETYPDVYNHLLKYKTQLMERNQAETGVRYEWYALQRYGANYWQDFNKPKITWGNLALNSQFAFTNENYIINAPAPFIATDNLYLLAVLNSKIGEYYIKNLGVARNGGYIEYKPMFVEQLPIPMVGIVEQMLFNTLVLEIIFKKSKDIDTQNLEQRINEMVYDVYGLDAKARNYLDGFSTL